MLATIKSYKSLSANLKSIESQYIRTQDNIQAKYPYEITIRSYLFPNLFPRSYNLYWVKVHYFKQNTKLKNAELN